MRLVRRGLALCVLGALLTTVAGGCGQDSQDPSSDSANPGNGAAGAGNGAVSTPLVSKPPDWYVSTNDRFERVLVTNGVAQVSPGGLYLLVTQTADSNGSDAAAPDGRLAQYRVIELTGKTTVYTVSSAALCGLLDQPTGAPPEVRVTDDGWFLFRAGAAPAAVPAAGGWRRYFPSTGTAKPLFDGFAVLALSRNLNFGLGYKTDAPTERLLLDLSQVKSGGVLRIEPLPAEIGAAVTVVGDTGVIALQDGRLRLRDGGLIPPLAGAAPWVGGFLRCARVEDGVIVATLNDPPVQADLPLHTTAWWIFSDRVLTFDGTQLWAADPLVGPEFRSMPLVLTANDPAGAMGPNGAREIISIAVSSEDVVVLLEHDADGRVHSAVYRWTVLH